MCDVRPDTPDFIGTGSCAGLILLLRRRLKFTFFDFSQPSTTAHCPLLLATVAVTKVAD